MARPEKFGHDYFSFYTRSDESNHEDLLAMINNNGYEGYVAVLELDCLIRGATPDSNGYYIILDQRNSKKLSNVTKLSDKKLEAIIEKALEIGHYDRDMYNKFGILTSRRIQEDHINTSVKRNNLLIKKEYMLLSSKDIRELGIKRKLICIEDFYIWKDTQAEMINNSKNDENDVFIDSKNEVFSSNNPIFSSNNSVFSSNNTQIKINKRKINKKENEIILNSESNSNCNGNCNSNDEDKPLDLIDLSTLHNFLKPFIREELFLGDEMDIYAVNDFLFELQKPTKEGGYGYSPRQIREACKKVKNTLRNKTDDELAAIGDWEEYMRTALFNSLQSKPWSEIEEETEIKDDEQNTEPLTKDTNDFNKTIEELERLKIARVMKKNKCTFEEAKKIMAHDREVRKNLKLGDDDDA